MSRIHEALQKAAGGPGDQHPPAVAPVMSGPSDHLVNAFPTEGRGSDGVQVAPVAAATASAIAVPPVAAPTVAESTQASTVEHAPPMTFERVDSRYAGKVVVDQDISPTSREQYRRLAASLHHAQAASGIKVIMLTSALMGEGKTLTSSNLALTLSESYKKNVLLVDADLRRPALHALFRLRQGVGLTDGLAGTDLKMPVHQVSTRLGILNAGRPTSDPIAGLTSTRMRRLLDEARASFDWIILDTPPVALLPDANLLSAMVDGAVIVVRAGATPWDLVQRAVASVGVDRLLGVVLNGAAPAHDASYYGYDYYTKPHEVPVNT